MGPFSFWVVTSIALLIYQVAKYKLGYQADFESVFDNSYWIGYAMIAVAWGWVKV